MTTSSSYSMGEDFETLDDETKTAVRELVEKVGRTLYAESQRFRLGEIYVYPRNGGAIAWGINGAPNGHCIARDIARKI